MSSITPLPVELSAQFQLRRLARLRWGLISFELLFALIGLSSAFTVISWPLIFLLLATHSATNLLLHYLPLQARHITLTVTLSCVTDLLLLSCLLALSGGTSNGLVALLLLPVAFGSILLPVVSSYLLALLAVIAYSLLLMFADAAMGSFGVSGAGAVHQHHAMANEPGATANSFNQHLIQMWWAFSLSAAMISWFVSTQAQLIRQKARQITLLQQQQLQQEQALAVATYAAGAAHDLASPIQTMALLADELRQPHDTVLQMREQLQRCQQIVQTLRQNAGQIRTSEALQSLVQVLEQAINHWQSSRPDISVSLTQAAALPTVQLAGLSALPGAIYNILDNAAEAGVKQGQARLELTLAAQAGVLTLGIRDFGEGLSAQRLAQLGKMPQPSSDGLGLGQYLANITVESLGGQIERVNLQGGGMLTKLSFQIQTVRAP